jgi:glycosyltransferase involved in cell wall biosynthesis
MLSLIIPSYRNPKCLDLCLKSALEGQLNQNEIIVILDGFKEESNHLIEKYGDKVGFLMLNKNQGMPSALNYGVYQANFEVIVIINDDNVLCKDWDSIIEEELELNQVLTISQIEPAEGLFNVTAKDFGTHPDDFDYEGFKKYEPTIRTESLTPDGGVFPFAMFKKDYMIVGGFDTIYKSPFICDLDFFLKLELNSLKFSRTSKAHFYHFLSMATRKGKDKKDMKASEAPAFITFTSKWGFQPLIYKNNSHNPRTNTIIKGIKYE